MSGWDVPQIDRFHALLVVSLGVAIDADDSASSWVTLIQRDPNLLSLSRIDVPAALRYVRLFALLSPASARCPPLMRHLHPQQPQQHAIRVGILRVVLEDRPLEVLHRQPVLRERLADRVAEQRQ